jgi:hypothetical protein
MHVTSRPQGPGTNTDTAKTPNRNSSQGPADKPGKTLQVWSCPLHGRTKRVFLNSKREDITSVYQTLETSTSYDCGVIWNSNIWGWSHGMNRGGVHWHGANGNTQGWSPPTLGNSFHGMLENVESCRQFSRVLLIQSLYDIMRTGVFQWAGSHPDSLRIRAFHCESL